MNAKTFLITSLLAAVNAGSGFAAVPTAPKPESRISVVFVEPEKFTDLKYDSMDDYSPALLEQIYQFMVETGERYVPAGMRLEIKVTDISLAGKFEPWRGPRFDNVRIVRSIYPPCFKLEFTLTDARGNVVKSGKREIRDLGFDMRMAWPPRDYLRYEKDMLRDWFHDEFKSAKVASN